MDRYYFPEKMMYDQQLSHTNILYKPIMIYYFVDPFCPSCWQFDITLRKLTAEYGQLFTIRPIVKYTGNHMKMPTLLNNKSKQDFHVYYGSLGVKAATLQGNKKGRQFLTHMQDAIFLYDYTDNMESVFYHAINHTPIDQHEFLNDLQSNIAKRAYIADKQLQEEMGVTQFPTLIFSSQYNEDPSIKIAGFHHYDTYTFILRKMLRKNIAPQQSLTMESYLHHYKKAQTDEMAFIFNVTKVEAEKKLKQLQLMQKVKSTMMNNHQYWQLNE